MSSWQNRLPEPDPAAVAEHLQLPDTNDVSFHFYPLLGRVVVITADAVKLALGLRHFRTASRDSGWDVDVMSHEEFEHHTDQYRRAFAEFDGIDNDLANRLVTEGYLSFDDLTVIDPDDLSRLGQLSETEVEHVIQQAEIKAADLHRR